MTREEKERQLTRLQKRLLRFQGWMAEVKPIPNNEENRFDNLAVNIFEQIKPCIHAKFLIHKFLKIQAIKTK